MTRRTRNGAALVASLAVLAAGAGVAIAQNPVPQLPTVPSDATVQVAAIDGLPNGGSGFAVATCPAGTRAVGGGIGTAAAPVLLPIGLAYGVLLNGPLDETGVAANTQNDDAARQWYGAVRNDAGIPQSFKVLALCSRTSDAVLRLARIDNLASGSSASALATCPGGTRVVGGGITTSTAPNPAAVSPSTPYAAMLSTPIAESGSLAAIQDAGTFAAVQDGDVARSWFGLVFNSTGAPQSFGVYALCSATSDATIKVAAIGTLEQAHSGSATAACPPGRRIVGGGIVTPTAPNAGGFQRAPYVTELSGPVDETGTTAATQNGDVARGWLGRIGNWNGAPAAFTVLGLCASEAPAPVAAPTTPTPTSTPTTPAPTTTTPRPTTPAGPRIKLTATPKRVPRGSRTTFTFTARVGSRRVARALVRFAGQRAFTSRRGTTTITVALARARIATADKAGYRRGKFTVRLARR
jgi:hypothetical protein